MSQSHRRRNTKAGKQSLLQNRLAMAGLCAGIVLLLAVVWSLGTSETFVSTLIVLTTLYLSILIVILQMSILIWS